MDLIPTGTGGTEVVWTGTLRPAVPRTARPTDAALRRLSTGFARRPATAAPRVEVPARPRPGCAT